MKTLYTLVSVALILSAITSCSSDCSELQAEVQQLSAELHQRDSTLDSFGDMMRSIDSNLVSLSELEMNLVENLKEPKKNADVIEMNVSQVREIMSRNEEYIEKMQVTANANQRLAKNLIGVIEAMQQKVFQGNLRLARHNSELELLGDDFQGLFQDYLDSEVARMELEQDINAMEGNINEMENKMRELKNYLNTGYIAIGTKKELIDKGILEKGGLLQAREINEDADKMAFKPVDTRQTNKVDLGTDKFKLVTEHPTSSYVIAGDGAASYIEIENEKEFWSISKYLVVIKN